MTPPIDLEPLREEIEQRFATYTYPQLIKWLGDEHGIVVTKRTLIRRLKKWDLFHREAALTPTALESISFLFHTTTDNDDDIAATLNAQGIPISGRQVKRARLSQGWRRRNRLAEQQEEQRRTTAEAVGKSESPSYLNDSDLRLRKCADGSSTKDGTSLTCSSLCLVQLHYFPSPSTKRWPRLGSFFASDEYPFSERTYRRILDVSRYTSLRSQIPLIPP